MYRVKQVASLAHFYPVRTAPSNIFVNSCHTRIQITQSINTRRFFSSSKDDGKKVGDRENESHPKSQDSSCSDPVKLKNIRPIDINPCNPSYKMKIPSIHDCPTPNEMSQLPQPEGSWYEYANARNKKGQKVLVFGVLFTAVSIGAMYLWGWGHAPEDRKKSGTVTKSKKGQEKFREPKNSKDIPKEVPYLLIGGGTASFSAFRAIKSSDPTAKVLMVSNEPYFPYMRPPLSKEIWFNDDQNAVKALIFKQWNGSERSLFYEPDDFYTDCKELMSTKNGGISVARGWTITHLDVIEKLAYLDDGEAIHYEKCLIATGATPKLSPVFQVAVQDDRLKDKIKVFRNIDDFKSAFEEFEKSRSVAIVGGGFLGSELACAFGRRDKRKVKQIYQIFRETGNMGRILPEYLSFWTTDKVREEGVNVIPNTEIVGLREDNGQAVLTLSSGKSVTVDFILVSVGVEPNTKLAEKSDLEVDPDLGGYLVNTELQARSDLYIAGDCACFYDPRLGRRRIEHHDHSVVSGRLAGENMAGARKPYYHQSMFWSDLGPEVGYEAIGIVDSSLPTVGVFAKATDKDTPQAVVTKTDEGDRSKTEELPQECEKYLSDEEKEKLREAKSKLSPKVGEGEDFGKGVIFYLRDDIVVGIVLWNVFNRMSIARQVLKDQKKYDDLNEVAKLFNIHDIEPESEGSSHSDQSGEKSAHNEAHKAHNEEESEQSEEKNE